MTENGKDVPLPSIINITGVSRVTRSGRIFSKRTEDIAAGKQAHVEIPF
jgi:ribosomal protein S5